MQSYIKNRVKLWEQIEFKGNKSVATAFLRTLTDFLCIVHSVRLQKWKLHISMVTIKHISHTHAELHKKPSETLGADWI